MQINVHEKTNILEPFTYLYRGGWECALEFLLHSSLRKTLLIQVAVAIEWGFIQDVSLGGEKYHCQTVFQAKTLGFDLYWMSFVS